jgi:hypothetical protein
MELLEHLFRASVAPTSGGLIFFKGYDAKGGFE